VPELCSANRQLGAPAGVSTLKQLVFQVCARFSQVSETKQHLKSGTAFALSFTTLTRASPLKKELQPWGISKKV
jgi:hypothetical protein